MMFPKEIKDIQEKIESLEDEKKHLINEKIIQIFYNIKNDKNYEKVFFKKNWKVLLLCHLIEGEDYQDNYNENGEKYKDEMDNFNDVLSKNLPDSISEFENNIEFEREKDNSFNYIQVLFCKEVVDEDFVCYIKYNFNEEFVKIADFYFKNKRGYDNVFETLNSYFKDCDKCKFLSLCGNRDKYEKKVLCM